MLNEVSLSGMQTWQFGHFKRFGHRPIIVVPHINVSTVETGQEPWLCRMQVDAFDAVRALGEQSLRDSFVESH